MTVLRDLRICAHTRHPGIFALVGTAGALVAASALAESEDAATPPSTSSSTPAPENSAAAAPPAAPAPTQAAVHAPDRAIQLKAPTPPPEPCEAEEGASEGAGGFFIGAGLFDMSSLNDRLAANGYERLTSLVTLIGGEGHAVFESGFVAGARGAALLSPAGNGPDGMQAQLNGGFGMVDLGFAPVRTRNVLLTLTAGIGGYGRSLDIGNGRSASFDDVLKNPARSVSLDQGGVLVGLTLGIDGRVPVGEVKHGRRGFFTLGLRIGGLYGPAMGDWGMSRGSNATGGPNLALAGGYAALVIGFGGGAADIRGKRQ